MTSPTARRQVGILNPKGLHLRPARGSSSSRARSGRQVRVRCNGKSVNGKSILDMSILAAECGTTLDIEAEGPDAEDAVSALADLVAARFHMEDDGDGEAF